MKSLIAFLLLFSSLMIQANPDTFDCSVKNLLISDKTGAESFIKGNLQKRFIIAVDYDDVIVTSISDTYSSSVTKYRILSKELSTVKAINDDSSTTQKTIMLHIENGDSTISHQGSFHAIVWLLGCKKQ